MSRKHPCSRIGCLCIWHLKYIVFLIVVIMLYSLKSVRYVEQGYKPRVYYRNGSIILRVYVVQMKNIKEVIFASLCDKLMTIVNYHC